MKQHTDIQVLFLKALQSQNPAVHGASMTAVTSYITVQKIPKQLLQETLREMLQALGNHRTLSLPLLKGMHRLLEVLSDWFNLSLGDKLIDHLAHWLDLETLLKERIKGWAQGEVHRGRVASVAAARLGEALLLMLGAAAGLLRQSSTC
jgi:transformation/transcription domain-associated protein